MSEHLQVAVEAAYAAGGLLMANYGRELFVDLSEAHDIKLELDRRAQLLIERVLVGRYPNISILGEEGVVGSGGDGDEWVIDPLDGTVNFFYGIPHFAVSIALRCGGDIKVGVVYDPARDELWTVDYEGPALLNGREVRVSGRRELREAVISVGVSKSVDSIDHGVPLLDRLIRRVKKCRMMGSAALDMAYVACGRLDAYMERQISLWDIAAGKLLVERAGGVVEVGEGWTGRDKFSVMASSGRVDFGVSVGNGSGSLG